MKTIVEKIVSYLPDGWVRDALLLALEGRDLIEEKNAREIEHETLVMSFVELIIFCVGWAAFARTGKSSPCHINRA